MDLGFTTAVYVVAAILFILSLGGLSGQESAKRAVWYGIVGMGLAVLATVIGPGAGLWQLTAILIAIGGLIGYQLASKVEMTQMPELVAGMHALVGLAAIFVGFNAHFELANVLTMDDTAKKKRLKGLPHCWLRNLAPRLIFCVLRHRLASGLVRLLSPAR